MENKNMFQNIGEYFMNQEASKSDLIPSINPIGKPIKINYNESIFKELADDIKVPIERQINAIEDIANSAKSQANSSSAISESAKIQADIAVKKSKEADIKGWIAIILSAGALFIELATNYDAILKFLDNFLNK